jgi:D-xylose transport system permease protein
MSAPDLRKTSIRRTEDGASPQHVDLPIDSMAAIDFANDIGASTARESFVNYVNRLRAGDMGALPAIAGLVVLVAIFAGVSDTFHTKGNFANLLTQAAPIILLAMGLVFVLLLGEIDLSAGTLSGVAAAIMGLAVTQNGNLSTALGTTVYLIVLAGLIAGGVVAAWYRIWPGVVLVIIGVALVLSPWDQYAIPAIFVAVTVGVSIGCLVGVLVAKVGIPSFVVTLALFLGWQGVLLKFLGNGSAIDVRRNDSSSSWRTPTSPRPSDGRSGRSRLRSTSASRSGGHCGAGGPR